MDMSLVENKILETITAMRQEYNACTARAVANVMKMNPDTIRYRMNDLKMKGLVDWNSVPGSLMRTDGKLTDQQFIAKILTLSHIPEVQEAIDEFYLVTPEKNPSKPAPKTTKKRATKATAT